MTHQEIEQQEMIERYVRNRLTLDERRAFEEHFFICDECFEQVQMAERLIAGVRYAAETGLLDPEKPEAKAFSSWTTWLRPAFMATATAALALTVMVVWLLFYRMPELRRELTDERQARERIEQESRQALDQTLEQLQAEQQERAKLESRLQQKEQGQSGKQKSELEANVPLVMLEATRGEAAANQITISPGAKSLIIWIETEPGARFARFRMQVFTMGGHLVQTVEGLKKNAYGALAARLPAAPFETGTYLVKLYGLDRQQSTLVGEYRLQIKHR